MVIVIHMIHIKWHVNRLKTDTRLIGLVTEAAMFGSISILFGTFSQGKQLKSSLGLAPSTSIRSSSFAIALRQIWQKFRDFTILHPNITKLSSLLLAILPLAGTASAASWYVRPVAQGAATGQDWNNAWSVSNVSWGNVQPGDTVWLAGGSYPTGLTISASGAAGNPILVYRATSSDTAATSAAGWNSSFDSQIQLPGADGIFIPSNSHIVVDGRTPNNTLNASPFGIYVTVSRSGGPGVEAGTSGNTVTDLTFKNIEVNGQYWNQNGNPAATSDVRGFKISPSTGSIDHVTIDHCRIRGTDLAIHTLCNFLTLQYSTIQDTWPSDPTQHPDMLYTYPQTDETLRYNYFINCETDGIFFEFGGATRFYFYGNVVYNTTNHMIFFKEGSNPPYGPFFIYNNTFQAPGTGSYQYGYISANNSTLTGASQVYNNIFYNVQNSFSGLAGVTSDYNAYNYTTLGGYGWPSGESHSFTFTGTPFVNLPAYSGVDTSNYGDYHLTSSVASTFQNGLALTQDGSINKDVDGKTRGSPWYIGAYQYGTSAPVTPPTGLHVVVTP